MSKLLYSIVSPSNSENLFIAISYNKEKIVKYYNLLKSVNPNMDIIIAKTDYDLEEEVLLPFGMPEVKKV